MNDEEMRDARRRILAWTRRPPVLSPRAARTRVLARLPGRRPRPMFRLAAAILVAAALAAGVFVFLPEEPAAPLVEEPSHGLLVYVLESGTKVYLDLPARPDEGNGR